MAQGVVQAGMSESRGGVDVANGIQPRKPQAEMLGSLARRWGGLVRKRVADYLYDRVPRAVMAAYRRQAAEADESGEE